MGETWPRAQVLRGAKRKGVRYFGPYGHAWAIRDTLDALTRVFPVRTCSKAFFDQRARARRPCLYYDIGRCAGPCVPEVTGVTEESYRADVDAMASFLAGDARPVLQRLEREMREFSEDAELRAGGEAARPAVRGATSPRVPGDGAVPARGPRRDRAWPRTTSRPRSRCSSSAAGGCSGRKGWVVDRVEQLDRPQLVASFLEQLYMERPDPPPTVLVPTLPADADVIGAWLEGVRGGRGSGSRSPSAGRSASSRRS